MKKYTFTAVPVIYYIGRKQATVASVLSHTGYKASASLTFIQRSFYPHGESTYPF